MSSPFPLSRCQRRAAISIGPVLSPIEGMVEAVTIHPRLLYLADEEADSGVLIDLMDQIQVGGISNISIAAEPGPG